MLKEHPLFKISAKEFESAHINIWSKKHVPAATRQTPSKLFLQTQNVAATALYDHGPGLKTATWSTQGSN